MVSKNIFSRFWKWIKGLFFSKKDIRTNKKTNKGNKEGKSVNSDQITGDKNIVKKYTTVNDNRTYTYHNYPTNDKISSPVVKDREKDLGEKVEKKERTAKQNPEKNQEISQHEFEELSMKVKFIVFGIMGNIKWEKVEPLEFRKDKEDNELAKLTFKVEEKWCFIMFIILEKNNQELQKMDAYGIVESFIF